MIFLAVEKNLGKFAKNIAQYQSKSINMKKLSLVFALLIAFAMPSFALSPDELVGKWESKWANIPTEDRSMSMKEKETINLNADSLFAIKAEAQLSILGQPAIDAFFYIEAEGKWKLEADSLVFHVDPATVKLEFPESEIRISGLNNPDQESMIKSQMHYNLRKMGPELKKSFTNFSYKNIVLTEDKKGRKLECTDPENGNIVRKYTSKKSKK